MFQRPGRCVTSDVRRLHVPHLAARAAHAVQTVQGRRHAEPSKVHRRYGLRKKVAGTKEAEVII